MILTMIVIFDCEDQMKNNNEENSLRIPFPWSLFRQSDLAPLMETETVQLTMMMTMMMMRVRRICRSCLMMFTKALSLDPLVNNLLNDFISCPLEIQGGGAFQKVTMSLTGSLRPCHSCKTLPLRIEDEILQIFHPKDICSHQWGYIDFEVDLVSELSPDFGMFSGW